MPFWPYEVHGLDCSLEYLTDVKKTFSREKRAQLRAYPRLAMNLTANLKGPEIRRTRELIEISDGLMKVPDWRYPQFIKGGGSTSFKIDQRYPKPDVGDEVFLVKGKEYILTKVTAVSATRVAVEANHLSNFVMLFVRELVLTSEPEIKATGYDTADVTISGVDPTFKGIKITGNTRLYLTMDYSGSMTVTRLESQRRAVITLLTNMRDDAISADIRLAVFSSTLGPMITKYSATVADYDEMISWMETVTHSGGTSFMAATDGFPAFFQDTPEGVQEIILLVTDGESTTADAEATRNRIIEHGNMPTYCFNIDNTIITHTEIIDNTPEDGVPIVTGENSDQLYNSIINAIGDQIQGAFPYFRGVPVASRPDYLGSPKSNIKVAQSVYDEAIGPITMIKNQYDMEHMSTVSMISNDPLDAFYVDKFLQGLKGRLRQFWKPTWYHDYQLYTGHTKGQKLFRVTEVNTPPEAIAIRLKDGKTSYHMVLSVTDSTFEIAPPLPYDVAFYNLHSISRMELHRLDSDVVDLKFNAPYSMEVNIPTKRIYRELDNK